MEQRSNENDSMALQNCFDQNLGVQELYQKLELQTRLTEYWKSIALKYEPNHADPMWSFNHTEKVTTELLEEPSTPPPVSDKVFKRNYGAPFTTSTVHKLIHFISFCSISMWHLQRMLRETRRTRNTHSHSAWHSETSVH